MGEWYRRMVRRSQNSSRCSRCKKLSEQELCRSCRLKTYDKRLRKHLRGLVSKDMKVKVLNELSRKTLQRNCKTPVEIVDDGEEILLLPFPMESLLDSFLSHIMGEGEIKHKLLFEPLTMIELEEYARSLNERPPDIERNSYSAFLEELAAQYPDIKYSLRRSAKEQIDIESIK